jgi:replication factor C subunit 1
MLVAQECGYAPIEFNASDTRSKLAIKDHISQIIDNRSLNEFFTHSSNNKPQAKKKAVVIMDEVDGMSAGDRGGMAELIQLIKKTQTPFICICNDRSNQKVRSLLNYCKDIRFKRYDFSTLFRSLTILFVRPTILQMVPRLKGVARNEKLVIDDLSVEKVAEAARGDMRQAIGLLHMLSLDKKGPIKYSEQFKSNLSASAKNIDLGPFDATTRLIATAEPLQDRLQYYFVDSSLVPLFIHENYLTIRPYFLTKVKGVDNQTLSHLESLSACADSLSDGDLVDKAIYSGTHWELQPIHAVMSTIKPTTIMRGTLSEQLRFPRYIVIIIIALICVY